jgi:hypothetical protein
MGMGDKRQICNCVVSTALLHAEPLQRMLVASTGTDFDSIVSGRCDGKHWVD